MSIDLWKQNCPEAMLIIKDTPTFLLWLLFNVEHTTVIKQCWLWSLAQFLNVFTSVLGYNTEERLCWGWSHMACYWWMWSIHSHSMNFPLCHFQYAWTYHVSLITRPPLLIKMHKTTSSLSWSCHSHFVSFYLKLIA